MISGGHVARTVLKAASRAVALLEARGANSIAAES